MGTQIVKSLGELWTSTRPRTVLVHLRIRWELTITKAQEQRMSRWSVNKPKRSWKDGCLRKFLSLRLETQSLGPQHGSSSSSWSSTLLSLTEKICADPISPVDTGWVFSQLSPGCNSSRAPLCDIAPSGWHLWVMLWSPLVMHEGWGNQIYRSSGKLCIEMLSTRNLI